ncbi:MAG TPA: SDR family NAD(P)-dependent oxidoreductase, partial [Acidimicrobiales bacterium]|nr:SDR family NAD(P)-dependent oxidoreductase [Acidimicrobiales bacterium]
MDLGLEGRVALVTASSSGLGRASAEALAAEGAKVVLTARGESKLRQVESDLSQRGAEVLAIADDISRPDAPAALV